jgi:hypothetical protein
LPKGAKILNQETSVDVEEIENGYLITRRTEYKYYTTDPENYNWTTITKKYFSEDDPLTISTDDKELAEVFAD